MFGNLFGQIVQISTLYSALCDLSCVSVCLKRAFQLSKMELLNIVGFWLLLKDQYFCLHVTGQVVLSDTLQPWTSARSVKSDNNLDRWLQNQTLILKLWAWSFNLAMPQEILFTNYRENFHLSHSKRSVEISLKILQIQNIPEDTFQMSCNFNWIDAFLHLHTGIADGIWAHQGLKPVRVKRKELVRP